MFPFLFYLETSAIMYSITSIHDASQIKLPELNSLLRQLNPDLKPIDQSHVEKIMRTDTIFLFGAFDDSKKLIGMISVAIFPIPSGMRCWIEDIVVDRMHRGKGLGKKLMKHAIEYAQECGAQCIDLTSRPSRIEANEMYQRMGFEKRETNVYRMQVAP